MEPDGKCVSRDREQSADLGEIAPEAGDEDHGGDATGDRSNLQTVDGQAVIEAGGAEVREQRLVESRRAAEDDRLDHVARLAPQSNRRVAGEPASDPVA